ncbi:hypothetical protein QZN11_01480 [Streptomyces gramineus]|uniref:hypothetical protein n=1 Tax=Streptomyces gramineus TaxID=910542 RepID=UPI00398AB900
MSSHTPATVPAAPGIPERAEDLRVLPRHRHGRWTAAVAVLPLLGLTAASVVRNVEKHYARGTGTDR